MFCIVTDGDTPGDGIIRVSNTRVRKKDASNMPGM